MAKVHVATHMKFLDAASHLMLQSCPAASAHLQLEFSDIAASRTVELPEQRKHEVCGACGYIATPASSTPLAFEPSGKKRKGAIKSGVEPEDKVLVSECKKCGYKTTSRVPVPPRRHSKGQGRERQTTVTDGSNSRVKLSRKQKQAQARTSGSLQSMLAKSRTSGAGAGREPSSGFGLNLFDIMKTG
jgi:RNase P subunit RPR2